MPRIPTVRQHDATDCAAACLRSVAQHYGLRLPIARLRQLAGTDRRGTTVLGLVEAATTLGFLARGVRGTPESLDRLPTPAVAHVRLPNGALHYVVVYGVTTSDVTVMDPGDGRVHRLPRAAFIDGWTGVLVLLAPGELFRPGDRSASVPRRLWRVARPHRAALVQALVGSVLATVLGLSTSVFVQQLVDHVLVDGTRNLLNLLGVAMLAALAAQLALTVGRGLLAARVGQRIDAALVLGYRDHLLRLPQQLFDRMRVGEVLSRVNDALHIRAFVNEVALAMLVNALVVVCSLALLFAYAWRLALVACAFAALYAGVFALVNARNRREQRALMERAAELESQLVETVGGIATVKRCGLEADAALRIETRFVGLLRAAYRSGITALSAATATEALARGATLALLWVGAVLAMERTLTPGELMSCYTLLGYLTGPLTALVAGNRAVQEAFVAADRLFELMDLEPEPAGGPLTLAPDAVGDLVLEDVRFRYGARATVLDGLTLTIAAGRTTAIVGESGSGKSTIAALLQAIHPPVEGRYLIGGRDHRHYATASVRRAIGVVPQTVTLFAGSLLENVAVGELEPDVERVWSLCRALGMTPLVDRLPQGLATPIGENGATLSGGERQRLAIARALYHDPPVLVLDEATAALDALAERQVQAVLAERRARGHTTVVIAHRLRTVRDADRIVVLAGGRVVEEGTHAELLRRAEGAYARLWREQHGGADAPAVPPRALARGRLPRMALAPSRWRSRPRGRRVRRAPGDAGDAWGGRAPRPPSPSVASPPTAVAPQVTGQIAKQ